MNGNENSPPSGQESSGTANQIHTDGGVSRRRFVGAASALAFVPGVGRAEQRQESSIETNYGATRTSLPKREGISSSVELGEVIDEDASLSANGYWYDEEPSQVELNIGTRAAQVKLTLSPAHAREFASDIQLAAHHADYGEDGGLGEAEVETILPKLIELHEEADWTSVPGITASEAAAWTSRLIEAHDDLSGGGA